MLPFGDGWAVLGELAKWVPVSTDRIVDISVDSGACIACVRVDVCVRACVRACAHAVVPDFLDHTRVRAREVERAALVFT